MSQPVIPPSFRRRRPPASVLAARWTVVIAGLLLGIWFFSNIFTLLFGLAFGNDETLEANPTVTVTEKASQKAKTKCPDADVVVAVEIDETEFAKGTPQSVTTLITSIATAKCFRDLGGTANEIFVQDPTGKVLFSTDKCQTKPKQNLVTLAPGDIYKISFTWYANKTPKGCGNETVSVNRGEYQLFARNGNSISEPVTLTIK